MRHPSLLILPAAVLALAGPASAGAMVTGTLTAISPTHLVLALADGKAQTIPLAKDTMFMKGSAMIGADQVKAGMRVMVALGADNRTAAHVMVQ